MTIKEKLEAIADNMHLVYEAGVNAGGGDYYNNVWDSIQKNGTRTNYEATFKGRVWNDILFRPKYNLTVENGARMFEDCGITDLKGILEEQGVTLDMSKNARWSNTFYNTYLVNLPIIDMSATTNAGLITYTFGVSPIKTIEKLILPGNLNGNYPSTFIQLSQLEEIEFGGILNKNGFDISQSTKLKRASIESLIDDALSPDTNGLTVTLSLEAVNREFESEEGANDGADKAGWWELTQHAPNWTFNLI